MIRLTQPLGFVVVLIVVALTAAGAAVAQDDWDDDAPMPVEGHGFAEGAVGGRVVKNNVHTDDILMSDARFGGIASAESAFYDSRNGRDGTDPILTNSHVRGLAGCEREVIVKRNLGLQDYTEWTLNHSDLLAASPTPAFEPSEWQPLPTPRRTQHVRPEALTLSLFTYWSPDDEDGHTRAAITPKRSDAVTLTAGADLMWDDAHTCFDPLRDDTSLCARVRNSF